MKEKLIKKLSDLSEEAEKLVAERSEINDRFNQIEVRLAQVIGAMQEIDSLLKEENHQAST